MTPTSGPPVRTLLFGDSVAFTMAFAMGLSGAPGLDLDSQAQLGCGVVFNQQDSAHGTPGTPPPYCRLGAPAAQQWPADWRAQVDRFHPEVVVLVTGRWEVTDQLIDGRWLHVGDAAFDTLLRGDLEQAVRIATSTGALMILERPPCFDSGEQDSGQPWPEDASARLHAFDAVLAQVAAEFPTVAVGSLGDRMCPGGVFTSEVDGVRIRSSDGIHVPATVAAGRWAAGVLEPQVVRLGELQRRGLGVSGSPLPARPPNP